MKGPQVMVLSAFSFSLMSLCVKQLGDRIPVAEVVFIRALISLALSWWVIQRQGVNPWGNQPPMLVWRGVVGTLALFCFYSAISQLPLGAATVLQYLYPTFTAALAWGALGEQAGKRIVLAMALGWLGVLLVAQPDWLGQLTGGNTMDPLPAIAVAIGITGALLTALAYVTVRLLANNEHRSVIIFYFPLMSVPMALPFVLLNPVWPNATDWAWLLGVGLFTQLGQIFLTQGLASMPAARATAINYIQVIFASVLGLLFLGESVNPITATGAALILAATITTTISPFKTTRP